MTEVLKEYDATINGVETTVLLHDDDATANGLDPAAGRDVPPYEGVDISGAEPEVEPQEKQGGASNKAQKATSNK